MPLYDIPVHCNRDGGFFLVFADVFDRKHPTPVPLRSPMTGSEQPTNEDANLPNRTLILVFHVIDLSLLKRARVVDVDRLRLGVEIEDLPAAVAMAVPGVLTPPNGMCASAPIVGPLTYVIPASNSCIARKARATWFV